MKDLELHIDDGQIVIDMRQTRLTMTYKRDAPGLIEEPLSRLGTKGLATFARRRGTQPAIKRERLAGSTDRVRRLIGEAPFKAHSPSLIFSPVNAAPNPKAHGR